jgi:hypothetical protein
MQELAVSPSPELRVQIMTDQQAIMNYLAVVTPQNPLGLQAIMECLETYLCSAGDTAKPTGSRAR